MKKFINLALIFFITVLLHACVTPPPSTFPFPPSAPPAKSSPPSSKKPTDSAPKKESDPSEQSESPNSTQQGKPKPGADGGLGSPQPTWESKDPQYGSESKQRRESANKSGSRDQDIRIDEESAQEGNAEITKDTGQSSPESSKQQNKKNTGDDLEWDPLVPPGARGGTVKESELEKELNESIAIFENEVLGARAQVIRNAPPPIDSENIPGVASLENDDVRGPNSPANEDGDMTLNDSENPGFGESEDPTGTKPIAQSSSRPSGSIESASSDRGASSLIPDDIPDPQGDDIVAQQLREIAVAESDPTLKAKLWEEYKRYKASL